MNSVEILSRALRALEEGRRVFILVMYCYDGQDICDALSRQSSEVFIVDRDDEQEFSVRIIKKKED